MSLKGTHSVDLPKVMGTLPNVLQFNPKSEVKSEILQIELLEVTGQNTRVMC